MELEGFKRCHALLSDHGVPVNSLTTDRHMSIAKYVREEWSDVQHFFDIWHIAKGMFHNYRLAKAMCFPNTDANDT